MAFTVRVSISDLLTGLFNERVPVATLNEYVVPDFTVKLVVLDQLP